MIRIFRPGSSSMFALSLLLLFCMILLQPARGGKNFYDVLGVSKTSSPADIKRAYRKQCLQHHPDKGGSEEKFKEINQAYEILSDDEQRKTYDHFGEAGINSGGIPPQANPFQQPGQGPGFFGFNSGQQQPGGGFSFGGMDMGDLFRGAAGQNAGKGGLNLDLSELLSQLGGQGGGGLGGGNPFRSGPQRPQRQRQQQTYQMDCPCTLEELATGATKKMKVSLGAKNKKMSKVYTISLKKGCKQGTKFNFKASKKDRFPPMTFVVKEKKHHIFIRRGDDLVYRHDLAKDEEGSLVKLELTLLDGEVWTRSLAPNSSFLRSGQTLEVTGKGMPIKGGPQRGNLIVEFYDSSQKKRSKQSSKAKHRPS